MQAQHAQAAGAPTYGVQAARFNKAADEAEGPDYLGPVLQQWKKSSSSGDSAATSSTPPPAATTSGAAGSGAVAAAMAALEKAPTMQNRQRTEMFGGRDIPPGITKEAYEDLLKRQAGAVTGGAVYGLRDRLGS